MTVVLHSGGVVVIVVIVELKGKYVKYVQYIKQHRSHAMTFSLINMPVALWKEGNQPKHLWYALGNGQQ